MERELTWKTSSWPVVAFMRPALWVSTSRRLSVLARGAKVVLESYELRSSFHTSMVCLVAVLLVARLVRAATPLLPLRKARMSRLSPGSRSWRTRGRDRFWSR